MDTPESMKPELAAWNNGDGIDLETWVANEGNFSCGWLRVYLLARIHLV